MPSRLKTAGERLLPASVRERRESEREEVRRREEAERAEQKRRVAERERAAKIAARRERLLQGDADLSEFCVEGRAYFGRRVRSFPAARAASRSSGDATIRYGTGTPASCSAYQAGLLVLPTRRVVVSSTG